METNRFALLSQGCDFFDILPYQSFSSSSFSCFRSGSLDLISLTYQLLIRYVVVNPLDSVVISGLRLRENEPGQCC